jgi:thiol:disulfide interchange protein
MVRQRNIPSKNHSSSKKLSRRANGTIQSTSSSTISAIKQNPSENLDDETKLAKRHLTKEMWQLVSIAVKRMADELVSISNNQQAVTRTVHQEPQTTTIPNNHQTTSVDTNNLPVQSSTVQQPIIKNTGAGDVPSIKEKSIVFKEPIKRRTLPMQMLEPSINIKKKGISYNATRRSIKSKVQNKSSKRNGKVTAQRLRNNNK